MKNVKFLKIIVVAILAINIFVIGYIILHKDVYLDNRPPKPREIVIKKIGFNTFQIKQYDVSITKHQNKIKSLDDSIRKTKNELYAHLKESETEIDINDSLVIQINKYQKQIEIAHYNHFIVIKKLCNKQQSEKFNALTNELSKMFSGKRKPKNER